MDAQQFFKSMFNVLKNEDYSISVDIDRYQGILRHALSKVDFSIGTGIYRLPSNLNLNKGKNEGYNKKILRSNADMKLGSNKNANKTEVYHKTLPAAPSKSFREQDAAHAAPEMH